MEFIIRNGVVIDGTGNPWIKADVGVEGDRIVRVGDLSGVKADQEIDAKGMTVTPGFVDAHSHSDHFVLTGPLYENKLMQGITTEINGVCGFSFAPLGEEVWVGESWLEEPSYKSRFKVMPWKEAKKIFVRHGIDMDLRTQDEYYKKIEERGISINYCNFTGHFALRAAVTGKITQPRVSDSELEEMKKLLVQAMKDGAMGFSTERGSHTKAPIDEGEVLELAKEAAKYGGFFASDLRGYRYDSKGELEELHTATEAIIEEIETVEAAGVRGIIGHIGGKKHENLNYALRQIEEARARGVDIIFDQMACVEPMTQSLDDYLPEWAREGGDKAIISRLKDPETRKKVKEEMVKGGIDNYRFTPETYPMKANWWHNVQLEWCPANRELEGKTFAQLSKMRGTDPIDVILDLIVETDNTTRFTTASVHYTSTHSRSEEMTIKILTHPLNMFGTDGSTVKGRRRTYWGVERLHYSPFPNILEWYVKEKKPLQEAIRKLTSAPCQFYGFEDRGLIRKGMYADIVVFDPAGVHSNVTAMEVPERTTEGIEYVLVNGVVVIDGGMHTGARPGKVLRREIRT